MKRLIVFSLCLLVVMCLSVSAYCAGETIKILGIKQAFLEAFQKLAPQFEKETGIKVEFDMIGFEGLREKEMLEMSNPKGNYDIITPYRQVVALFAASGLIMPLDDLIAQNNVDTSNIFPLVLKGHQYQGKQVSMPVQADTRMFYYRSDIWDAAGLGIPPKSWDELYASAKKLTTEVDGKKQYGTSINAQKGVWVVVNAETYVYANGGNFFDDKNVPIFNSKENIETFTFLKKLLDDTAPPDVLSWTLTNSLAGIREGLVASCVMWTGGGTVMRDEPIAKKLKYSLIPTRTPETNRAASGGLGGWGFAIPANSAKKELAFKFISWAIRKDIALENAKIGGDSPAQGFIYGILADKDLSLEWVAKSLALTTPTAHYPEYPQIEDILSLGMHESLSGAKPVEQALIEANNKLMALMKKAGLI